MKKVKKVIHGQKVTAKVYLIPKAKEPGSNPMAQDLDLLLLANGQRRVGTPLQDEH